MAARAPQKAQRETIAKLLLAAFEGKAEWLDTMVQGVGYQRPDAGISQAGLEAAVPSLTRATLSHWVADGLASEKRGSRRVYQWLDLVNYLYERFVVPGRPRAGGGGSAADLIAEQTRDTRWKADLRELQYKVTVGELVEKTEVQQKVIRMVLQCVATLLGMAATLAPQLEHQPAADVRQTLDRYILWLIDRMAHKQCHVPAAAVAGIREVIDTACPPKPERKPARKRRRKRKKSASS